MSEGLLGKIIVILFVVTLLITDWKDIWLKGGSAYGLFSQKNRG